MKQQHLVRQYRLLRFNSKGGYDMKFIFAKHDGCNKEFVFEVPINMHPTRSDILWVETSKGETVAVATSDVILSDNAELLVKKLGAYLPLKKVKAYANKSMQIYIENRTYREVSAFCQDRCSSIYENGIPF